MTKMNEQQNNGPLSEVYIVSDLDDTLLNDNHELSTENRKAIEEYIDLGGNFSIATGRHISSVKRLNIPMTKPAILFNGSVIYDYKNDSILWQKPLDDTAITLINDILRVFPGVGLEVATLNGDYLIAHNKSTAQHIEIENLHPHIWNNKPLEDIPDSFQKIIVEWEPDQLAIIYAFLEEKKKSTEFPFNFNFTYPEMIEIIDKNSNKGIALYEFSKLCDTSIDGIIAIGDNQNDFDFVKNAGFGIAVANAHDTIKSCADCICQENNQHIMVSILENLKKDKDFYKTRRTI